MTPLVSIIIPSHDRALLLEETLKSIQDQSIKNFECIVIIDSKLETYSEIRDRFHQDARFQFLACTGIKRSSLPRNIGLNSAKGSLIAFCDDDDSWHPQKLEIQLKCFEEFHSPILVCSNYKTFNKESIIFDEIDSLNKERFKIINKHILKFRNIIPLSSVILNRDIFDEGKRFSNKMGVIDDWEFWLRASKQYKIIRVNANLMHYRIHDGNLYTSNKWKLRKQFFYTHLNALEYTNILDFLASILTLGFHFYVSLISFFIDLLKKK